MRQASAQYEVVNKPCWCPLSWSPRLLQVANIFQVIKLIVSMLSTMKDI